MRLPSRLAPLAFALITSGFMSLLVSGLATLRALGLQPDFGAIWMQSWAFSWAVAFPTLLVVAPIVRRVVARITEAP